MKITHTASTVLLTGGLLAGSAINSQAQIIANYQNNGTSASFYSGSITANLIQNGQSSLGGVVTDTSALNGVFNAAGLNDGSAAGNGNKTYYEVTSVNGTFMPNTATFQLTAGYDITSIQAISGWTDHNLGEQTFQLFLSIGGGAFTSYGTFINNTPLGSGNNSYLTTLTDSSGIIASDVTGVRFVFQNPDTSNGIGSVGTSQAGGGSAGGTVIHELQVFGTISPVPEPTTSVLFGAGILGFAVVFRRRQAC